MPKKNLVKMESAVKKRFITRKRKSTAGERKISHPWNDKEIQRLINAVKKRALLWNAGLSDNKMSRLDAWREVVAELNIDGMTITEAKTKWLALRATFKTNLAKSRQRKSGQGTRESQTKLWRHFKQMLFLEDIVQTATTQPTSTFDLTSTDANDIVIKLDSPQTTPPNPFQSNNRQCVELPPVQNSPVRNNLEEIQPKAVTTLPISDANSACCDHILSELSALPNNKAQRLRRLLINVMYDFLESHS
ncbi:uncharacterized protein LOC119680399 [Teleopsis dalmanni]|uniref:uncharacterized protein LOC119679184 n=1 Tax=Teleopsis dalmanni TaxID=139649 RepID=UPI0018CE7852|nr:uncharacterized protein LOC119679184 [Teleopsis dalmanni]XP_037949118.1 uncharacterized protein LOC119680399 [Teleopsis dalmanni]